MVDKRQGNKRGRGTHMFHGRTSTYLVIAKKNILLNKPAAYRKRNEKNLKIHKTIKTKANCVENEAENTPADCQRYTLSHLLLFICSQ